MCGCGANFNVICDKVVMHGTARSFCNATQKRIRNGVSRVATGVADAMGAKASTSFDDVNYGYPATVNTDYEAALMHEAAALVVGEEGVLSGRSIMTMAGEDFSYFQQKVPGCFVFVGATPLDAEAKQHHHPSFDFDEESLVIGASLWVRLVEVVLTEEHACKRKRVTQ